MDGGQAHCFDDIKSADGIVGRTCAPIFPSAKTSREAHENEAAVAPRRSASQPSGHSVLAAKGAASSMPVKSENATPSHAKPAPSSGNGGDSESARRKSFKGASAQEMSARQRDISVAEFFQKNRHMLGFDNKRKALLTTVKEAVDNSLDACEEAGILPDITVKIEVAANGDGSWPASPAQAERFIVTIADNGPGIVKKNVGKVFAKLLYGSKFHRLRMSRGQQGIGISAAGMYGQLTTGKPTRVLSKIKGEEKIHSFEISIDTKRNEPVEHETNEYIWNAEAGTGASNGRGIKPIRWTTESGTSVSIELTGEYRKGKQSVDEYLELTSVANPHASFTYVAPDGEKRVFARGIDYLPEQPKEIKPHPHGIELGMLLKMLQDTSSHWLSGFLAGDFCRVSTKNAEEICKAAGLSPRARPRDIVGHDAEKLFKALQSAKLMAPPTDCISPIGEEAIKAGLFKTITSAEFMHAVTRPPKVYRGNPFIVEAGIAYGNIQQAVRAAKAATDDASGGNPEAEAKAEGEDDDDEVQLAEVIRFANRVPLQYQATACATFKAVLKTAWKNYGVTQSKGALPHGPMTIFIHIASVWVPFTNQAKEAVAEYDEIMEEIKRALQECGRKLGIWIRKRQHAKLEYERRNVFQRYIEEVAEACNKIKGGKLDAEKLKKQLQKIAAEITGGEEVDRLLKKKKQEEQDELSGAIIRTVEGIQGEVAPLALEAAGAAGGSAQVRPAPEPELIAGAAEKSAGGRNRPAAEPRTKSASGGAAKKGKSGKQDGPGLFE